MRHWGEVLEAQAGATSPARKRAFTDATDAVEAQSQPQNELRAPKRRRVLLKGGEAGALRSGTQADRSLSRRQSTQPAAAGSESLRDIASRAVQAAAWVTSIAQEAKCAADELANATRKASLSLGSGVCSAEKVMESAVACDQLATMLSGVCSAAADLTNLAQEASLHATHIDVVTSMTTAIDVPLDGATDELISQGIASFRNFMVAVTGNIPEELT